VLNGKISALKSDIATLQVISLLKLYRFLLLLLLNTIALFLSSGIRLLLACSLNFACVLHSYRVNLRPRTRRLPKQGRLLNLTSSTLAFFFKIIHNFFGIN
jgi:hypothetical protein